MGYSHTSYGARALADVLAEIDLYQQWYATIDVFVDEVSENCALVASYYGPIFAHVKAKGGVVALNPGSDSDPCE